MSDGPPVGGLSTALTTVGADDLIVAGVPAAEIVRSYSFEDLVVLLLGLDLDEKGRRVLRACLVVNPDHGLASNATTAAIAASATARTGVATGVAAGLLAVGEATISPRPVMVFLAEAVAEWATTPSAADASEVAGAAERVVERELRAGRRLPGYGSPFHQWGDPRVAPLRDVAVEARYWGRHCSLFDAIGQALAARGKRLPANEVGLCGAVLADLGLTPDQGEAVAVIGAVPSLVANVLLERTRSPRFLVARPPFDPGG